MRSSWVPAAFMSSCTDRGGRRQPRRAREGADLEEAAVRAAAVAVAVADLLPHRYRTVVTPALCLTDTDDVGFSVG